jgi:ubiquitin-protein ligase
MEILNEKLNVISNKNIRRRIERELLQLLEFNIIDPFNVYISFDNNRQTNYNKNYYTISFYSMKDNNLYVFELDIDYPFRPPKFYINYNPYLYYLYIRSPEFSQNLFKYYRIRCMCCETKLCYDNWSPIYTMKYILDEAQQFKKMNKTLISCIFINIIKRKYLIDNINIIEWLL